MSIARGIVTPLLRKIRAGKCPYRSREYLIFDCQIFNAIWPVFLRMMNMWINSIPGKWRSSLDCWERRWRRREIRRKTWVSLACLRYLNHNDSDPTRYYSFDTAFSFSAVLFADTHTHTRTLSPSLSLWLCLSCDTDWQRWIRFCSLSVEEQEARIQLIELRLIPDCMYGHVASLVHRCLLAIPKTFKHPVDMFAHGCILPVNPMCIPYWRPFVMGVYWMYVILVRSDWIHHSYLFS